VFPSIMLIKLM